MQRPILVKGHERALTMIKYNKEGDLLFTVSKDHAPSVWYADNGEHIGTYQGHAGACWCLAVNESSTMLLTGSADNTARLWDVPTGAELMSFPHKAPVRAVNFAQGDGKFLTALDNIMGNKPTISIYELTPHIRASSDGQSDAPVLQFIGHEGKINRALWGPANKTIATCSDDGTIRVWDAASGEQLRRVEAHRDKVTDLQYAWDHSFLVSASKDGSAKLWDADSYECLKTYECDRPLNSAHLSPLKECPYVVVGGGQDAMSVTTTSSKMGKLDAVFFHLVFEDELGSVKGHFGPINTLQIAPHGRRCARGGGRGEGDGGAGMARCAARGVRVALTRAPPDAAASHSARLAPPAAPACLRSFASGGEDGYVRIHHFDPSYFTAEEESLNPTFLQPAISADK